MELLNYEQVRSSIARRLGINSAGLVKSSRHIEGIVEMMLDATQRYDLPLTEKRIVWVACSTLPILDLVDRMQTGEVGGHRLVQCKLYLDLWEKKKFTIKLQAQTG